MCNGSVSPTHHPTAYDNTALQCAQIAQAHAAVIHENSSSGCSAVFSSIKSPKTAPLLSSLHAQILQSCYDLS